MVVVKPRLDEAFGSSAASCEICPACGSVDANQVRDSRVHALGRRRRRKCSNCGASWSTIEMRVEVALRMKTELVRALDRVDVRLKDIRKWLGPHSRFVEGDADDD